MSALLRLLRTTRLQNTFNKPKNPSHPMSNYFRPSSPSHLGLPRSRFYSNGSRYGGGGSNQIASNMAVLYGLMGINAAVFGYGMYTKLQFQQGFQGPFINFMRNWSCSLTDVVKNGAWWTILTSTFTHVEVFHLAGNMFTAYYLGRFLCYAPMITPARFLTIAIGSGLTGSVGFLYQRYLASGGSGFDGKRGLGFSGALMGITSVAACLSPATKVYLYGIVPVPLWGMVAGYAFFDGYYVNDNASRVGHAGHLGGLAFGIAYYLLRLRGLRF